MNIDSSVQKILLALLRKWKLIVIFAIIGALLRYFYTNNFTKLQYTSSVEFLAYAVDPNEDLNDSSTVTSSESTRVSYTSKMNYAMKMLDTYIEVMKTNKFHRQVADDLNESKNASYSASTIASALSIESISNTAMFKVTVTTDDADLSYDIAEQLETTIPKMMKKTNSGLVNASVEDKAVKATTAGSLGYAKKMTIAALVGAVIAAAYVLLRTLLDVRIRSEEELVEKYNIPVLGSIPNFETKASAQSKSIAKEVE